MTGPTIPPISLENDSSEMVVGNQDTYGLNFTLVAKEDWVYDFPKPPPPREYEAQILITIKIGEDEESLCTQSGAENISFLEGPNQSPSSGVYCKIDNTYSWTVTIGPENHVIIHETATIAINNIRPNNHAGPAVITLLPRFTNRAGNVFKQGTALQYTVTKTKSSVVISNVSWLPNEQPGPGTLTWYVDVHVENCTLQANGEPIGDPAYNKNGPSQYTANVILEAGTPTVTITATDQNQNTTSYQYDTGFQNLSSPYFVLQVSKGRALSMVQSDVTTYLGVVFKGQNGGEIWQNAYSGTQDNWKLQGPTVVPGYETSPCVYFKGVFLPPGRQPV